MTSTILDHARTFICDKCKQRGTPSPWILRDGVDLRLCVECEHELRKDIGTLMDEKSLVFVRG